MNEVSAAEWHDRLQKRGAIEVGIRSHKRGTTALEEEIGEAGWDDRRDYEVVGKAYIGGKILSFVLRDNPSGWLLLRNMSVPPEVERMVLAFPELESLEDG